MLRLFSAWSDEVALGDGALIGVVCSPAQYTQVARAVMETHADRTGTAEDAVENQVLVLTPGKLKGLSLMLSSSWNRSSFLTMHKVL